MQPQNQQPARVTMTHYIKIPPATDVMHLLGCYNNLVIARGCNSAVPFTADGDFTHPVPESYQQLLVDFMELNNKLNGLSMSYEAISLDNVIVHPTNQLATFFFSMQDKQDYALYTQL